MKQAQIEAMAKDLQNPGFAKRHRLPAEKFTGVARSLICHEQYGYKNFKILSIHIKDGVVEKIESSDPYGSWEAIAKMELQNYEAALSLNNKWEHGVALRK